MRNERPLLFLIFLIFKVLTRITKFGSIALLTLALAAYAIAQVKPPKTIFRDAAGELISNNEFVDLRLANPREKKDPATKIIHDDGTIEFRLAAVPQEGTDAPTFETTTLDGRHIATADLRGKVVVYNFWFIGCPGCLAEMPKLNSFVEKYKDRPDVVFIAVSRDSPQALRQFLSREKFTYQMVGSGDPILELFKFAGYPRNIIIGKDGKIAYWRTTVRSWEKFDSVIQAELAEN